MTSHPEDKPFIAAPPPENIEATIRIDANRAGGEAQTASESSLERLVGVVLDSAGVANRSATIAATSTNSLLDAVGDLDRMMANARRQSYLLLGLSLLGALATVIALALASMALNSRVANADATLMAVGKRVVELNGGVENLKRIEGLLEKAEPADQAAFQARLEQSIETALADMRKALGPTAVRNTPAEEARVQASLSALSGQMKALESQAQLQARAITRLTEQLGAARQEVATLTKVAGQLENQIQHERAKPATPSAPPQVRSRERREEQRSADFIQYPDPLLKKLDAQR